MSDGFYNISLDEKSWRVGGVYDVKTLSDNPNVVSKHQQQAQLLQGAGWEVEQSVSQSSQCSL